MDFNAHQPGLPGRSEDFTEKSHFSEIQKQRPKTSKRYIFCIFRLSAAMAMVIAALVLTLIILVSGRHGDGASDLALITVDMSNFARFTPPTIELVHNSINATKTSNSRRGLGGSFTSAIGSAASSVETFASGAASKVSSVASSVETGIAGAVASADAEVDKIIEVVGDKIEDIENALEGLMDKVLDTIQDDLNKWLGEAAKELNDLDIPNRMSLHLTTHCSSGSRNTTNSTQTSCKQLFRSGSTTFNSTLNNGTIFGFQPGSTLSKALGVFFVPASAQQDIAHPINNAVNEVQKLATEASNEISAWTVNLLFIPIVAIYTIAAVFTTILLLVLMAAVALAVKGDHDEGVPARIYSLCGTIAAISAFFMFLGSVILTVLALVVYILNLGGDVVGITITSGDRLKWISWSGFAIMAFVAVWLKVEEFVADCIFWWGFVMKILRLGRSKGGMREAIRDLEKK